MALARSLRNQLVGTVAVLDLGLSFQELTIYSDANPVFYRLLPAPQEPAFAVGLPELVHELSRSFAFIGWERGQKVERLLLVGYGATRADLPPVLEEQLGIGVAPGEPFRRLRVPSGMETSPEYATAVGLALRGVRP
jgi:Tfp pilus assembly PilM family ATPase